MGIGKFVKEIVIDLVKFVPIYRSGLTNIVTLMALYLIGTKDGLILSIVRVLLVGVTFGNLYSILYSLAGSLCSYLFMILAKKSKQFSMIGVSVIGGLFHNIGQISVAIFVVKTIQLIYYLPLLMISGVITGIVIGTTANIIIKNINNWKK